MPRGKKFTAEQIIGKLREAEVGLAQLEPAREVLGDDLVEGSLLGAATLVAAAWCRAGMRPEAGPRGKSAECSDHGQSGGRTEVVILRTLLAGCRPPASGGHAALRFFSSRPVRGSGTRRRLERFAQTRQNRPDQDFQGRPHPPRSRNSVILRENGREQGRLIRQEWVDERHAAPCETMLKVFTEHDAAVILCSNRHHKRVPHSKLVGHGEIERRLKRSPR